jgi:hypothetical protein
MIAEIQREAKERGITRLCHFTPSRNLLHIAEGRLGVLATAQLKGSVGAVFNPTDHHRFDGLEDYVCCSIEYPNAWYLSKAQEKEKVFKDWVLMFIRPDYLWQQGTLFCPRNAAAGRGTQVAAGQSAFKGLFEREVQGNMTWIRGANHLKCCPTDDQAEVLVPGCIHFTDILSVAVRSESQAKSIGVQLRLAVGSPHVFKIVVSPDLFDKRALSASIRLGKRPKERLWEQN